VTELNAAIGDLLKRLNEVRPIRRLGRMRRQPLEESKRARLKSVSKPGRETAPGFSLDGRQRWGARQILLGTPNITYAWCNL